METEYFLIIEPDRNTSEKLIAEKKRFAEMYNCPSIVASKPHISLARFVNESANEENIFHYLERKISAFNPFLLHMEGFDKFPTHTIFAKIKTQTRISEIVKSVKTEGKKLQMGKQSPYFVSGEAHLTLARGLQHWQYENGWKEWKHVPFSSRFEVRQITLLKKSSNRLHFDIANRFPLTGIKNEIIQTSLF